MLDQRSLSALFRDHGDHDLLQQLGGIDGLCGGVGVDPSQGVAAARPGELEDRVARFGASRLPQRKHRGFLSFLADAMQDKIIIILLVFASVSLVLGVTVREPYEEEDTRKTGWIEGMAILLAVCIIASVTASNDYAKDLKFRKLEERKEERHVKVRRDGGVESLLSVFDLVVGDVVLLETGDFVPADAVMMAGHGVQVDESSLTGEPDSVKKDPDHDPFLLSGCKVMAGSLEAVVAAVGVNSQWGMLQMSLRGKENEQTACGCLPCFRKNKGKDPDTENPELVVADKDDETPLQKKLGKLAERIALLGLIAAIFVFVWLVCRHGYTVATQGSPARAEQFVDLVHFFIVGITILVVAVPEGLPLAVTVSLAYSMQKMMKDNNLVRHLAACETMGGATNICSDKTGTLTENKMAVTHIYVGRQLHVPAVESGQKIDPETQQDIVDNAAINSTATVVREAGKKDELIGSKTECALVSLVESWGFDYRTLRKDAKPRVVQVFPFSSATKCMCTCVADSKGRVHVHVKGASEIVFAMCNSIRDAGGSVIPVNDEVRAEVCKVIEQLAAQGLRTLCLATRVIESFEAEGIDLSEQPTTGFTCSAVVGIKDPLRKEVPEAVEKCQRAGIKVRMVTGDNVLTAGHIARECGILRDGDVAMEGPDFRKLSDSEMGSLLPRLSVLARCSPQDKLRLVNFLKLRGEVVASTGDGTNDAPQLRAADVGFAMNIAGTEVAKEAADILLLDDNFASVVKAVAWGRNVFDSIRKFLQFQLTITLVTVILSIIGAVANGSLPFAAIQLLWVNLIMDTLAALALATEPPTPQLLLRAPYGRNDPLISPYMWRFILGHAVMQVILLVSILFVVSSSSAAAGPVNGVLLTPPLPPAQQPRPVKIAFVIDTSASMNQRVGDLGGMRLIDAAKSAVELMLTRSRSVPLRLEKCFLLTTADDALRVGWDAQPSALVDELKNLRASDATALGEATARALEVLNQFRALGECDRHTQGRTPALADCGAVVVVTDGGALVSPAGAAHEQLTLPGSLLPGAELYYEPFRWDQRVFALVLRVPGVRAQQNGSGAAASAPDASAQLQYLSPMCEVTGGRCVVVQSGKQLQSAVDSVVAAIGRPCVVACFEPSPRKPLAFDASRSQHVAMLIRGGAAAQSWWPIPEAYWVDSSMPAVPVRTAQPLIRVDTTAQFDGRVPDGLPHDKYDLDQCSLFDAIVAAQPLPGTKGGRPVAWPVYVAGSGRPQPGGSDDRPFGFLRVRRIVAPSAAPQQQQQGQGDEQAPAAQEPQVFVQLVVLAYDFPRFLRMYDELVGTHKMCPTPAWRQQFEQYLAEIPQYYVPYIRTVMKRIGTASLVPDFLDDFQSPQVSATLKAIRNRAKLESERISEKLMAAGRRSSSAASASSPMAGYAASLGAALPGAGERKPKSFHALLDSGVSDIYGDAGADDAKDGAGGDQALDPAGSLKAPESSALRNAFDIPRKNLVDSIAKLRERLFAASLPGAAGTGSAPDDAKHRVPIKEMSDFSSVLMRKEALALRPLDEERDRRNRRPLFGNPFRNADSREFPMDEADMEAVGQSGPRRSPSPSPQRRKRGFPGASLSVGPKPPKIARGVPRVVPLPDEKPAAATSSGAAAAAPAASPVPAAPAANVSPPPAAPPAAAKVPVALTPEQRRAAFLANCAKRLEVYRMLRAAGSVKTQALTAVLGSLEGDEAIVREFISDVVEQARGLGRLKLAEQLASRTTVAS
eukprot:m51a1_g6636 hypothetical protein (1737) ;mRNA; f:95474-104575